MENIKSQDLAEVVELTDLELEGVEFVNVTDGLAFPEGGASCCGGSYSCCCSSSCCC